MHTRRVAQHDAGTTLPRAVNRHKLALLVWLAMYPLLTLLSFLLAPFVDPLPLVLNTLVKSALLVPVMVYVLLPTITHVFATWLEQR